MNFVVGRTSVEEGLVQPVDIATDDLAVDPLLYWPVTDDTGDARWHDHRAAEYISREWRHDPVRQALTPDEGTKLSTATLRRLTTGLNYSAAGESAQNGHTLRKSF